MADDWDAAERKAALKKGHALPPLHEGEEPRYPINSCKDVKDAVRSLGRTKPSDRPAVRRYIARRAAELGCPLPSSWKVKRGEKS